MRTVQLRQSVGIYNVMQNKNAFNELARDIAGGIELLKMGYLETWIGIMGQEFWR